MTLQPHCHQEESQSHQSADRRGEARWGGAGPWGRSWSPRVQLCLELDLLAPRLLLKVSKSLWAHTSLGRLCSHLDRKS